MQQLAPPSAEIAATLAEPRPKAERRGFAGAWRETATGYAYLLPAAILLLGFHFLPVFYALYISVFNWRIRQGDFIGLRNYQNALTNPEFWDSLKITFYYALGIIPLTLIISFLVAYALFKAIRARGLMRLIYFLPYVTPVVAAALIFRWIFHSQHGVLNWLLETVGLPAQAWLLEPSGIFELLFGAFGITLPSWAVGPSLALVTIMIFTIWQSLGFSIVIMLAGLSNIPSEVYDAAKVDGAGEWTLLRRITLPLLSPTLFFLSVVSVIGAFQSFGSIYTMTDPNHGGPLGTTRNATMYIFLNFFEFQRLGYASAVAFILFFVVLILTIIQLRVIGPRVHYQ
jgi:multiple sugar transport system permease protein